MTILIAGAAIFFGAHLLPAAIGLHSRLTARFGATGVKAIVAVVSILGFVLIVHGWQRAGISMAYMPPEWGHEVNRILMIPAMILLVATYMPGNLKRFTRHPMLWATVLWASGHLLANGEERSLLLFGSFLVYSLFAMWSANRRGAQLAQRKRHVGLDVATVVVGAGVYLLAAHLHGFYTGVPLLG